MFCCLLHGLSGFSLPPFFVFLCHFSSPLFRLFFAAFLAFLRRLSGFSSPPFWLFFAAFLCFSQRPFFPLIFFSAAGFFSSSGKVDRCHFPKITVVFLLSSKVTVSLFLFISRFTAYFLTFRFYAVGKIFLIRQFTVICTVYAFYAVEVSIANLPVYRTLPLPSALGGNSSFSAFAVYRTLPVPSALGGNSSVSPSWLITHSPWAIEINGKIPA